MCCHRNRLWINVDFHWTPVMVAKGADDVLKLLMLNCCTSHALSFVTFSSTGGNGGTAGLLGVKPLGLMTFDLSSSSFLQSL